MSLPWPRLVLLGCIGLVMGTLSLFAVFPTPVEFLVWVAIALALWAPGIWRWAPARPLLAGLVIGVVSGLTTGGVQALFQGAYLEAHPEQTSEVAGLSATMIAGWFLAFAVVAGAVTGLVAGLVAWAVTSWRARRTPVVV